MTGSSAWRSISTPDGAMDAYGARAETPRGAVLVVHEAWGVTPYTCDVVDSLAEVGYHALAPDLLHRDPEPHPIPYGELDRLLPVLRRMDDGEVREDLAAVREELHGDGWRNEQVAVIGFCLGGRFALLAALTWRLGAAVSFYPGGVVEAQFPNLPPLIDRLEELATPWLTIFGETDETIPLGEVARLRDAVDRAPASVDLVVYPGVGHAFHNDRRDSHDRAAAEDGWGRALDWLERHVAG